MSIRDSNHMRPFNLRLRGAADRKRSRAAVRRSIMAFIAKLFSFVTVLVLQSEPAAVFAHEVRPASLQLTETQPEHFAVVWKVPQVGDMVLGLHPLWPEQCRDAVPVTRELLGQAAVERRLLDCSGGLIGKRIGIDGLNLTITDVLARIEFRDGVVQTNLVKPGEPWLVVEGRRPRYEVAREYVVHGISHILFGADHLLFVFGLLLLVRDGWMLVKTVTSFTIAHSITLAVATFGYANPPLPPLNAAIALSILFLGPEIVRAWREESSLTIRHPWVVAFAFGLLHGFGFAGALTDAGLPRAELPLALLSFNIGVEIGQVAFVALVLLMQRSFWQLEMRWPTWFERAPGYLVGSLGAFWTIQRIAILIGVMR
jgi:hydrogenase/urease accessory protein HupE